jgi:hypothetical protein
VVAFKINHEILDAIIIAFAYPDVEQKIQ